MKTCNGCHVEKPLADFYKARHTRDGLEHRCKKCNHAANRRSRKKHYDSAKASEQYQRRKEYHREKNHEWYLKNKSRRKALDSKYRLRKRGSLTEVDLELSTAYRSAIESDPCTYCGTQDPWDVFHVDHYFPISKGGDDRWYNLVQSCESCNLSKGARCGTWMILKRP